MMRLKNVAGLIYCGVLLALLFAPLLTGLPGAYSTVDSERNTPPSVQTPQLPNPLDFNIFSMGSTDFFHVTKESNSLKLTVPYTKPTVTNHKDSGQVRIVLGQDVQYTTQGGYPQMPYMTHTLVFPLGTRITDLQITPSEIETLPLLSKLETAPYPLPINTSPSRLEKKTTWTLASKSISPNIQSYPSKWGTYTLGGGLHDNQRVTILCIHTYPCQYLPNHDILKYTKEITIQLKYNQTPSNLPNKDTYDYLIITHQLYQDELKPLVAHKNNYGVKTILVTLNDIYNGSYFSVQGRDPQEKIKYFLKNAIENWGITHTLLVGDIESFPSREVYSFWWGGHPMFSDHYYADIYDSDMEFCSWDSNNNNLFGELDPERESTANDFVDLYADIYLGRLACYNKNEASTVVNKIITYETMAYGQDWFQNLILMGGDTFPFWNVVEGELVNEYVAQAMPEFNPIKIQMSEGNFLPHRINQILSNGAGFVCYSGHGFEYGFGTYPKDNRWMIAYYTPYLLGLKNEEKLPIIFFDACLTAKLDYYMLNNPNIPCFAWALVKKPNGGAIATIGATETATTTVDETGPWGQAGYLDLHFFMAYQPGISLGEMLVQAQNDYLIDVDKGIANNRFFAMTIEQFILLGDPTLLPGGYP